MKYLENVIKDAFTLLYQYLGISIIVAILFIIVWYQADKSSWKDLWKRFKNQMKDSIWKKRFILIIYFSFILQRTLFNRSPWGNPLGNVIGVWGWKVDGEPNYEMFENILLFIPLIPLYKISEIQGKTKVFDKARIILLPITVSLAIEIIQLFTRAGTFQLSDIAYNTIGGLIGGLVLLIIYAIRRIVKFGKN